MSHSISFRVALSAVVALALSSTAFAGGFSIAPGTSGTQLQSLSSGGDKGKNQGKCDPIDCSSQIISSFVSPIQVSFAAKTKKQKCDPVDCSSQFV